MWRYLLFALAILLFSPFQAPAQTLPFAENTLPDAKKFDDFKKLTENARNYEGLLRLHLKDEHLYAEIPMHTFGRLYLAPITLARGMGMGGHTLNFEEQWVIYFRRIGDKVQVVRRNVRFQAKRDTPISRAVETTYTDSVIQSVRIRAVNAEKNSVVIDLNDIFFRNFADLPYGQIDTDRTSWNRIKTFPKNIELQVSATFTNGAFSKSFGGDAESVIDPRGNTVIVHYGLLELPDGGYIPRVADDRVGHFLTVIKDFTRDDRDTTYVRYVNRWRLDRADGSVWKEGAKLVPPKKKIVFWIEKSVPDEYRAAVREGILEWNKAFEKIGFRDAIEVRQQENEDFDPEDVSYNTFRWIANDQGYAMGPSRANPLTGELIDADIIFDASMVRFYKSESAVYRNGQGEISEPASLIQAYRQGLTASWNESRGDDQRARVRSFRQGFCQCASHTSHELTLAMMAAMTRADVKQGEKIPEELIQQAIKEVVMHEVGHTLGLRHNFKASTMLKSEELHDTNITRKRGLVGSVMDYTPVNLAPKGVKQGDYFTTTIGPYDYWAIEYAYKPLSGGTEGEAEELKKIASRCAESGLAFGTDEDLMTTSDPHVNVWDLGSDPMKFGQDRMLLAEELLKGMAERVVEKGEGWAKSRMAFAMLLRQYGDAAFLTSRHIGGEHLYRDHKGDANARDPFIPVKPAKQREALKFLQEHLLTDRPFNFAPDLLRKLGVERWLHWGTESRVMRSTDYPINEQILNIQKVVLNELLDSDTLRRIQNTSLKVDPAEVPLTLSEVFRSLSDGVFADLKNGDKDGTAKSSIIRRNLQREYLRQLSGIILRGGNTPPDARSLARFHLKEITKRMEATLNDKKGIADDTIRAHLDESREMIAKVLNANISAGP